MNALQHQHGLMLIKLICVVLYAIGVGMAFSANDRAARKRAVHGFASPALLGIWLTGFALAHSVSVSLLELWVLAGLVLSFVSQGALVVGATKQEPPTLAWKLAAVLPIFVTLFFMIWKPTW